MAPIEYRHGMKLEMPYEAGFSMDLELIDMNGRVEVVSEKSITEHGVHWFWDGHSSTG